MDMFFNSASISEAFESAGEAQWQEGMSGWQFQDTSKQVLTGKPQLVVELQAFSNQGGTLALCSTIHWRRNQPSVYSLYWASLPPCPELSQKLK